MDRRKRYAVVGTGGRAMVFLDAIAGVHADAAILVAMCDTNLTRMTWQSERLRSAFGLQPVPSYIASQFQKMLAEQKPDVVIVCTPDWCHHFYVIAAMQGGCDVISEKPLTVDAEKAQAILDVIRSTGRSLRITFNVRYIPQVAKVRELILNDTIGKPTAAELAWSLDTSHGADYFRRWHREKLKSGGLLVHKASHHFDMINWWLGDWPESVYAVGGLRFYGRDNALARGDDQRTTYTRYTGEPAAKDDPFALLLDTTTPQAEGDVYAASTLRGLYLNAEAEDGYVRDQNVFGEGITIEDTLALTCRYRNCAVLSYSLVAYSPWEGFRAVISGTKGRIELCDQTTAQVASTSPIGGSPAAHNSPSLRLRVFPMFGESYEVDVENKGGGHSGGDPLLMADLFQPDPPADPVSRRAGPREGIAAMLVGVCGNQSLATGLPVRCDDVVTL